MLANNIMIVFRILVDADACPVKQEICELAAEYGLEVIFLASIAHHSQQQINYAHLKYIYVDNQSQAVDLAIMNQLQPGDIVVTQDIGLAAMVLGRGGQAISNRGMIFRQDNIESLLETRHFEARARQMGQRTKGPKPFTKLERKNFSTSLAAMIKKMLIFTKEQEIRQ